MLMRAFGWVLVFLFGFVAGGSVIHYLRQSELQKEKHRANQAVEQVRFLLDINEYYYKKIGVSLYRPTFDAPEEFAK